MSTLLRTTALCLLPCIALAADRPNVKLGLWEVTRESSSTAGGAPAMPADALAQLSPEVRARIEANAAARGGMGSRTSRYCLTQPELDRLSTSNEEGQRHCTRTVTAQSATSLEQSVVCKDPKREGFEMHGTIRWQVPNPGSAQGTMEFTSSMGAQPVSRQLKLSAKWLGADCGDVKPATPDK